MKTNNIKNKILITYSDMSLQSGNVVLISRRAEAYFSLYGVETICFVISKENMNIEHKIEGIRFDVVNSFDEIKLKLKSFDFDEIIFYGAKSYLLMHKVKRFIKKQNLIVKLYLDVQGAFEERIEFVKNKKLIVFLKFKFQKLVFRSSLKIADGVYVVSDPLKEYVQAHVGKRKKNLLFNKIRCGVTKSFSSIKLNEMRKKVRNELQISNETIVFGFSGYRMPWQRVEDIIELFKTYDSKIENIYFVFYCNTDSEFEKQLKESFPRGNYLVKFLNFDEYFTYLSMCDVGVILRDYNVTNKVAFPNKVSDYISSGLLVALNKAIPEPYNLLKDNVEFIDLELDSMEEILSKIENRSKDLDGFYERNNKFLEEQLMYKAQVLKNEENLLWRKSQL